jgi:hypothetical protein
VCSNHVMQLFEFIKNPPVLILWTKLGSKDNKRESKTLQNQQFSWKNQQWIGGFIWQVIGFFQKHWELWFIYQNQLFEFLRTMVLNLKNLHDKCQGLFLFLTTAQRHWFKPWGKVQLPFKCEPLPYTMIKHHIVAKWHFLSLYNIIITRLVRTNQEK